MLAVQPCPPARDETPNIKHAFPTPPPPLQGTATIMLDTEHQEAKEYPLDTQGTVTIKYKVTDLGDVMP